MAINKKTLSEQIYESLRRDIMSHRIVFGQKLINRDLQERFGVSSTPVRDAINHLYLDGLVDDITNSGARVIDFDLQFMQDINDMVSILCCAAVQRSAERADPAEVAAKLEAIIQKQLEPAADDHYYTYDNQFHKTFFDYCGNRQLADSYERYHVVWEVLVRRFHELKETHSESVAEHRQMAAAYKAGRFDEAVDIMRRHFARASELFDRYMK